MTQHYHSKPGEDKMYLGDVLNKIGVVVDEFIEHMSEVRAESIGLDTRSCRGTLYISDEGIAIEKNDDRNMQYYGGFDYVDRGYRHEMGDYIFYEVDDGRIKECVDHWSEQSDCSSSIAPEEYNE